VLYWCKSLDYQYLSTLSFPFLWWYNPILNTAGKDWSQEYYHTHCFLTELYVLYHRMYCSEFKNVNMNIQNSNKQYVKITELFLCSLITTFKGTDWKQTMCYFSCTQWSLLGKSAMREWSCDPTFQRLSLPLLSGLDVINPVSFRASNELLLPTPVCPFCRLESDCVVGREYHQ
jgi:hypothetical protein